MLSDFFSWSLGTVLIIIMHNFEFIEAYGSTRILRNHEKSCKHNFKTIFLFDLAGNRVKNKWYSRSLVDKIDFLDDWGHNRNEDKYSTPFNVVVLHKHILFNSNINEHRLDNLMYRKGSVWSKENPKALLRKQCSLANMAHRHWSHDPNSPSDKKLNMPSGNQFNSTSLQQLLIRKTQNTRFCLSASYSPKISLFTPVPFSKFYFSLSYSTFDCISPRKWYNNAACHILDKNINLLVSKKRHTGFQNTFHETSSVIQQSMWRNKANKKHMTIWSPTYQRSCLTS